MKDKLSLLKLRLAYLEEHVKEENADDDSCATSSEEQAPSTFSKYQNMTKKQGELETSKFDLNTVKTNLNNLALQNNAYLERTVVYPENNTLTFAQYDFMHIRMKG